MTKRLWLSLGAVAAVVAVSGGVTAFVWSVSETHFDRPDGGFDRLTTLIDNVPGAEVTASERWVEAPTFADVSSWIEVGVKVDALPVVLQSACDATYPDPVDWSLNILTGAGNTISVGTAWGTASSSDRGPCPDLGLDAAGVADRIDAGVTGQQINASVRDGRLALASFGDEVEDLDAVLALVADAEGVRGSAGIDASRSVEITSPTLSVFVETGEQTRYAALLSTLIEDHSVTGYFADADGSAADGVDRVQVVAPVQERDRIERLIRDSDLHIADFPVRFIGADR